MRVVVRHPARKEQDGTEVSESLSAFKFGRIHDYVDPITGAVTPAAEVAVTFLAQARKEHPGQEVFVQRLVQTAEGEPDEWVKYDEVPEDAVSPEGGEIREHEFHVEQSQEAS